MTNSLAGPFTVDRQSGGEFRLRLSGLLSRLGMAGLAPGDPYQSSLFALPQICCEAVSGRPEGAAVIGDAWRMLYAAAHLLDSVEDGDPLPPEFTSAPLAVNAAAGLIFSAGSLLASLNDLGLPGRCVADIQQAFHSISYRICAGQDLALSNAEPGLEEAWQIAEAKTGLSFALICYAGARLGTRSKRVLDGFYQVGEAIGLLVQIGDDLLDLFPSRGNSSDLSTSHWGLPVAYAMEYLSPDGRALLKKCLAEAAQDPSAEAEARSVILKSGAATYLSLEAERMRLVARRTLHAVCRASEARDRLESLLNEAGRSSRKSRPTV